MKPLLNPKDVNFLSVISQNTALPKDYLIGLARENQISEHAYEIFLVIIDPNNESGYCVSNKAVQAAGDFTKWAAELKRQPL